MVLAGLIAAVGILEDSPILVVGGDGGRPRVRADRRLLRRGGGASDRGSRCAPSWHCFVGFPVAITAVCLVMARLQGDGVAPDTFSEDDHGLANTISNPDFLAFFVAFCAGTAGILSLSSAKSGALIGVLVSVTTIPAAANIGSRSSTPTGSLAWLAGAAGDQRLGILLAGMLTLLIQRLFYRHRRMDHLKEDQAVRGSDGKVSAKSRATTTPRASSEPAGQRRR